MLVEIKKGEFTHSWTMVFDLGFICCNTGRKTREYGQTYVVLPIPQTKKIFKYIKTYADDETMEKIEEYLQNYP